MSNINNLIIDATSDKILLMLIKNKKIFTKTHKNIKANYEKLVVFINDILKNNRLSLKKINTIYVNKGPGSYSGIRNSISVVKAIAIIEKMDFYCFSFTDFLDIGSKKKILNNPQLVTKYHTFRYQDIPSLCIKYKIKKNLIKPLFWS